MQLTMMCAESHALRLEGHLCYLGLLVTPDSQMYPRWYGDKIWTMVPAQAIVGQFLMSFKEFPQRRKFAFFNFERVPDQMRARTY
jgi:hypothetical protein